jgi:hypothetical protein
MVALLWDAGHVNAALELEMLWNDLARELPFSLYCAYPEQPAAGDGHRDAVAQVCDLHAAVVSAPQAGARPAGLPTLRAEATRTFAGNKETPRAARHFVSEALEGWQGRGYTEDAALVVTELTANAVAHARSGFTVSIAAFEGALRISVGDTVPVRNTLPDSYMPVLQGHGLGVVAAVSANWGVQEMAGGKAVWADLRPREARDGSTSPAL